MKKIPEKTYRLLFFVGIAAKAVIAIGELAFGLAFSFFSYETLHGFAFALSGGELAESPRDLIWELVARGFHGFSTTPQAVWAFIFLSHGIVKIFLLTALWRNKLWAFPVSAVVFTLFIIYQLYQVSVTPSIILWAINVIDIAVVLLIIHEYRYRRRKIAAA